MFWIGLGVGTMLGTTFGALIMAVCAMGKDQCNAFNQTTNPRAGIFRNERARPDPFDGAESSRFEDEELANPTPAARLLPGRRL